MKKNTAVLVLILLFVILLFYITGNPEEKKYFPEFQGWIKISKFEVYNRFNLKKYVGIAERTYLKYGFKALFHQEYLKGCHYIIVDIFKMKSKKSARELLGYIKNPNDEDIKVGEAAAKSQSQIIFLKNAYYVRVFTFNEDYRSGKELLKFAKFIDSKMG